SSAARHSSIHLACGLTSKNSSPGGTTIPAPSGDFMPLTFGPACTLSVVSSLPALGLLRCSLIADKIALHRNLASPARDRRTKRSRLPQGRPFVGQARSIILDQRLFQSELIGAPLILAATMGGLEKSEFIGNSRLDVLFEQ